LFGLTYLAVALGRLPGLRIDRAGAALIGASLMVGFGVLPLDAAFRAIDLHTVTLLLGMMILVAYLRLSGLFRAVTDRTMGRARSPVALLLWVVALAGLLSAFLVNDAVCLVLTPAVAELTVRRGRDPVPYLLAVAMAANIGSVATITGNPQNMIIGTLSAIPYRTFTAAEAPVAVIGLALLVPLLILAHPGEFRAPMTAAPPPGRKPRVHIGLMVESASVTLAMIGAFFAGIAPAEVAIVGGAALLLSRRVKPRRIYAEIDWPLLLMFAGLFVVVAGMERAAITPGLLARVAATVDLGHPLVLIAGTAALSNLVSNVPAVLALKPLLAPLADPGRVWLLVAMAATLAGNLTLTGSVANLIVAERARAHGIHLSFGAYVRIGLPLTLLTLAVGLWRLG
jgi:Na+/H+ antiporter NhaD/arsenite permease-like protein